MRGISLVFCIFLVASATAQSLQDAFIEKTRFFSGEMFEALVTDPDNEVDNLIYSPLSIYETLGMLLAGSEGSTTAQILQGMQLSQAQLPGIEERDVHGFMYDLRYTLEEDQTGQTLLIANAMFVSSIFNLEDTYLGTLTGKYGAHYQSINTAMQSEAVNTINQWVEDNTQGTIQDLVSIDDIDPLTRLVLTNAVYFNASWKYSFHPAELKYFFLSNGTVVQREAMNTTASFRSYRSSEAQMEFVAIPYQSLADDTSYFVVGIPDLDFTAFNERAGDVLQALDVANWTAENIQLTLPKFEISTDLDVKPILEGMGIVDLFNEAQANLGGISSEQLYVSSFKHKAFITVNEEGTEASAASSATVDARIGPRQITVNRPFFYGIYNEQAKVFTFVGRINDPNPDQDV